MAAFTENLWKTRNEYLCLVSNLAGLVFALNVCFPRILKAFGGA